MKNLETFQTNKAPSKRNKEEPKNLNYISCCTKKRNWYIMKNKKGKSY